MKQVLLIDDSDVFRDYIQDKLTSKGISVSIGVGPLDTLSKMRTLIPDLVIMNFNANREELFDLLEKKHGDANAREVPLILLANDVSKDELARLADFPVKKIVPKPLKIDQFFEAVTAILRVDFDIDTTTCILEARVNDNIIFIEIAQGLNREKIDILKYKIRELINLYALASPKVLIMMTDLSLSFIDGPNLELLLDNVLSGPEVRNKNVKILTFDSFTREFINGNREYADIQVVTNLSNAIDSLIKDINPATDASSVISEKILSMTEDSERKDSALEMRFKSELESLKAVARDIRIAVIDDDVVIRTVLAKTFMSINAKVDQFESGLAFLADLHSKKYDLIFLDLMMPGMNGFEVLMKLKENGVESPVIVLSAISQREAVLKVLSSGVKSYMIKPLKPEAILKKAIEILQGPL
jgi:DNA-binding response OmpR family regulator